MLCFGGDPMGYRIEVKRSALKTLARTPAAVRRRLWAAISSLADEPRPRGCAKLGGERHLWRIRVGDYRAIYQVRDSERAVLVVLISHRRAAYR
jgi:mRNA interferase RelE/StbE